MQDALHLAIEGGLKFEIDDIAYIADYFSWGYWASDGEGFYSHTVVANNVSAIHALEHYFNRKPFIVDNVSQSWVGNYNFTERTRGRLAVYARFSWKGERVTVTSFNDKQGYVVACSYKDHKRDKDGYFTGALKVKHLYKITHKDLHEHRKAVTEFEKKQKAARQEQ
jgi:hypothetical protein